MSARVTSSEAMNRPCIASSAFDASDNCAESARVAVSASRSNALSARCRSHSATCRIARPNASVVITSGSATLRRRGAQSARGRPIRVSVIGAPISTPRLSPVHHVSHVTASAEGSTVPDRPNVSVVATLALTTQATGAPSR